MVNERDLAKHQEQVPRKQGLKPINACSRGIDIGHQEQVPRKQGLKLYGGELNITHAKHQEQVPRKQGLKQDQAQVVLFDRQNIKSKFHENKD